MVRNADKYYFPIKESIESILPIVDEFVVALGDNSEGDKTREIIESIGSDKVKIIDRVWSQQEFIDGNIFAKETNIALSECTGDWCFYLQADEVVHEKDLDNIKMYCQKYLDNEEVDGFLFHYNHFFGDYDHYLPVHSWYKNEIRIVRNRVGIYSYKDAQSFRRNDNQKLNVIEIEPYIYHYGWVRPPELMQSKRQEQASMHHGIDKSTDEYLLKPNEFDYGYLGSVAEFKDTHPAVMQGFISAIPWKHKLNYKHKGRLNRPKMKHEKFKYQLLSFLEKTFNGNRYFFGYSNWNKIKAD